MKGGEKLMGVGGNHLTSMAGGRRVHLAMITKNSWHVLERRYGCVLCVVDNLGAPMVSQV